MEFYVSVIECDNEFDTDINFYNSWDSLTTADKERYIKTAMKLIDKRSKWVGYPLQSSQKNSFPRDFSDIWLYTDNSDIYWRNHRIIPNEIKQVTFELIKELYSANYSQMFALQKSNVKSFSDGDMSVGFGDNNKENPGDGNTKIFNLLLPFTQIGYSNTAGINRTNRSPHIKRSVNRN